ncbi:HAD family phosphatase [Candidatus Bipolaricaulota bacterium]|nr:HAD family phosphatase [Candidatus Bipolaricaulota bacterium]
MKGKPGAIFDLDGVLVDSSSFHLEAWRLLAWEEGFPVQVTESWFRDTFGLRNDAILATLAGRPLAPFEVARLSRRKEELFRELAQGKLRPLPGAVELVSGLQRAGVLLAVGTSAPRANLEFILGELGLSGFFTCTVTAEDVVWGKPDPEVFLKAAQGLGLPPWRCVVFEDAEAGVEAARRAGMLCVGVATTHPPERLYRAGARLVVGSLEEIRVTRLLELF